MTLNGKLDAVRPPSLEMTSLEKYKVPAVVRGVNAFERVLNAAGMLRRRTDVETVKVLAWRDAEKHQGPLDFGWDAVPVRWDGIEHIIANIRDASRNTLMAWQGTILELRRLLSMAVEVEAYHRAHPEAANTPITRPIFVTGFPRTGTTLLHRLISSDPANRAPLFWELYSPIPNKNETSSAARIARAQNFLRLQRFATPGLKVAHPLDVFEAEECLFLLMHHMSWPARVNMPDYRAWIKTYDKHIEYTRHAKILQVMQHAAQSHGKTWVLKTPVHLDGMGALLHTYPDALIVVTHRAPAAVIPSWASLMGFPAQISLHNLDWHAFGAMWVDLWELALQHAESVRERYADRFIDLQYEDIVADPQGAVERVYAAANRPLTDAARSAIRGWLEKPENAKSEPHVYTAEQFGLSDAGLNARFAWYIEKYGIRT